MKLYFIRHKPSGLYLPKPAGRAGRGGSHVEPSAFCFARIFRSERSAKIALNAWLKGKWVADRGYTDGHPGNDWEREYYEEVSIIPQSSRIRTDMEIVEKEILL